MQARECKWLIQAPIPSDNQSTTGMEQGVFVADSFSSFLSDWKIQRSDDKGRSNPPLFHLRSISTCEPEYFVLEELYWTEEAEPHQKRFHYHGSIWLDR
ncbi:uncharacterized protein LDX57_002042 [Aspergillus melleus]|uniref:uncharacterized protein n=1 Tax=Aspergillus melleus TaxID=138277 RepID=UPI001E8E2FF0|nr:uncharacterized protein LDX57_002042 [Aspergillus melleus]KAH8424290.1 hypothetical protein LDX57_002042 [Aspergillus melleus]